MELGFMKSKLVMSFYRAAKTSSSPSNTRVEYVEPSCKVSVAKHGGGFGGSDGYVHGRGGGGGDEHVDGKAASYIHQVKERRRLEELKIVEEEM